jgi:hypothetical protein
MAALKAGMSVETARKYRKHRRLPGELTPAHTCRTRNDPFAEVWDMVLNSLEAEPGIEATAIFNRLRILHPGRFSDGQVRTLQRKVRQWRAKQMR